MCKTLTAEMIPRLQNRVGTIISKEHEKRNPHVILIGVTVHETQDDEITQLHKVEHIRLQESIRQGNLQLRELEKD